MEGMASQHIMRRRKRKGFCKWPTFQRRQQKQNVYINNLEQELYSENQEIKLTIELDFYTPEPNSASIATSVYALAFIFDIIFTAAFVVETPKTFHGNC